MTYTLSHPVSSPTTTITFDTVRRIGRTRQITKVMQAGDIDGNAVAESAGASILSLKVNFELLSDATKSALEKWDELDELVRTSNEDDMRFSGTYTTSLGSKTQTYDGKVIGLTADDVEGDPDSILGTFDMAVVTKGAVT